MVHGALVDAENVHGRLAEVRALGGDGDGLGGEGSHTRDPVLLGEPLTRVVGDGLVEVAGPFGGRLAEGPALLGVLAVREHLDVDLSKVL
jgi:hypothetical protein